MMASNLASPGVHVLARRPSPPPPLCPPGPSNSPWMPGSVGVATCRAGRTQQGHRIVRPVTSPTTRPMPAAAAAADGAVAGRKYSMIRLEKSVPCLTADAVPSKRTGYMGREPQQARGRAWRDSRILDPGRPDGDRRDSEGDHRGETCLPTCHDTQERIRRGFFGTWRSSGRKFHPHLGFLPTPEFATN